MTATVFLPLMANAFDEDAKKCMEAGMNAHLTKPIVSSKFWDNTADEKAPPKGGAF